MLNMQGKSTNCLWLAINFDIREGKRGEMRGRGEGKEGKREEKEGEGV